MNLRINKYPKYLIDISLASSLKNFTKDKNTSLDIGCGDGELLTELALNNPSKYFIGLEIKYGRIVKSLKKAELNKLKNLKFIFCDANLLIKEIIPKNSLNKVFINNPDPWPKDKHEKNRLINSNFLMNLHEIIKKEITKTRFATSTKKSLFDKTLPNTKFQKLFLKENKKIYSLKLQKK